MNHETADKLRSVLSKIRATIEKSGAKLSTNEALTRTSLVNEFLDGMGYDPRDPDEVIPEYTADIGSKKGEKVDYAVMVDDKPAILIEAKKLGTDLSDASATQLARYYQTESDVNIGIFTDGQFYHFYTSAEKQNLMDKESFFIFDVLNFSDDDLEYLLKYRKQHIEETLQIVSSEAQQLKRKKYLKQQLLKNLNEPTWDFAKFFAKIVEPNSRFTERIFEEYSHCIKIAGNELINEQVAEKLNEALTSVKESAPKTETKEPVAEKPVSTDEERAVFEIIKAIAAEDELHEDVYLRAFTYNSCCLWDNTQRCKIATFRLREHNSHITIHSPDGDVTIETTKIADLYKHRDEIRKAIKQYR